MIKIYILQAKFTELISRNQETRVLKKVLKFIFAQNDDDSIGIITALYQLDYAIHKLNSGIHAKYFLSEILPAGDDGTF